jgi:insertion element IS1 protein InsB
MLEERDIERHDLVSAHGLLPCDRARPDCQDVDVVRYGKQRHGPQRYRCNNTDCPRHIFLLHYQNQGRLPAVKQQMVEMALNGSGIRDTARVLRVSPTPVISILKKKMQAYSK